jgi:hypothetical protein
LHFLVQTGQHTSLQWFIGTSPILFARIMPRINLDHNAARDRAEEARAAHVADDDRVELRPARLERLVELLDLFHGRQFETDVEVMRPIDSVLAGVFDDDVEIVALQDLAGRKAGHGTAEVALEERGCGCDVAGRETDVVELHCLRYGRHGLTPDWSNASRATEQG